VDPVNAAALIDRFRLDPRAPVALMPGAEYGPTCRFWIIPCSPW